MAYKRKRGYSAPARKKPRYAQKSYPKRRFGPYRPVRAPINSCIVKCDRINFLDNSHIATSGDNAGTILTAMKLGDLRFSSKFLRFASMYDSFKVLSMKAVVNAQGFTGVLVTAYDSNDDAFPVAMSHLHAQNTSRIHQLTETKVSSHSVNLQSIAKYRDWSKTEGCANASSAFFLGEESMKSSIGMGFPGLSGFSHKSHVHISITETYVVQFYGMKDKFSTTNINPAAIAGLTAFGPSNQMDD